MKKKPLKETGPAGIEAKTKRYAMKLGFWVRKFNSMANPAVPDDIFVSPSGVIFFIEFKSPGKKPTHKQEENIQAILSRGGRAFVVDNLHEPGITFWKKDFNENIGIWHDGYALIDLMATL